jgi:hypothetical protein
MTQESSGLKRMRANAEAALFAGNTRSSVGFKSLPTLAHLFPALIEHDDELIDDLQQSARIGLRSCQCAKLSPVFFIDSHVIARARTWPNTNATFVEEEAVETADAKRVAPWALVTRLRRQYENISRNQANRTDSRWLRNLKVDRLATFFRTTVSAVSNIDAAQLTISYALLNRRSH